MQILLVNNAVVIRQLFILCFLLNSVDFGSRVTGETTWDIDLITSGTYWGV
jgi:hypothetical protein